MKQNELLNRIKAEIEHISPGAEIILYGSVARGEETEDSDIDLLILVDSDKLHYTEKEKIIFPLYDMNITENIHISPQVYTKKEWYERPFYTPFMINVYNEGIRL